MKRMWSEEEIQSCKKDISNLVDSKGNPRFVEGEGTPLTQEGFTATYCKWSLSGTHLMLVLAGSVASGTTIPALSIMASYNLPAWILDKIVPVTGSIVEYKSIAAYASDYSTQTVNSFFRKSTDVAIAINGAFTLTANRNFRIQYDLLIDSE